ncbi:Exonuclease mut-7 [Mortierella sp. AM989]|nr:Exonuclease mut-7 [Mortierella sp. AM989]
MVDVQKFIAANNAFEVVYVLLNSCHSLGALQHEIKLGNADRVRQKIIDCMQCHITDPALFTIHTIISVGVIAESRSLDRNFEKAISKLLSDPLRRIASLNQRGIQNQMSGNISNANNQHQSGQDVVLATEVTISTSASAEVRDGENDLIILDDGDGTSGPVGDFITRMASRNSKNHAKLQSHGANSVSGRRPLNYSLNLLDDDDSGHGISNTNCLAPLQPMAPRSAPLIWPSRLKEPYNAAEQLQDPRIASSRRTDDFSRDGSWSNHSESIDFWTGDQSTQNISDHPQNVYKIDEEDPCDTEHIDAEHPSVEGACNPASTNSNKLSNRKNDSSDCVFPIEPRHQQLLLGEVAAGKSILQVSAVLDIFNMRQCLSRMTPQIEHKVTETFGSSLVRQLLEMNELKEAVAVVTEFFETRDYDLDLEILAQLLITGDLATVHEFVGDVREVCMVTLQYIDQRFFTLLALWDQAGYFDLLPNSARSDPSVSPDPDLPATPSTELLDQILENQTGVRSTLVEIAMSLSMRFNIESSLIQLRSRFPSLSFFARYCTTITLFDSVSASGAPRTSSRDGSQEVERSGFVMLQSPWMILPYVISLIRDDPRIQCMAIRHCILERHDHVTAGFLAAKLDLGRVYQRWAIVDSKVKALEGQEPRRPVTIPSVEIMSVSHTSSPSVSPTSWLRHAIPDTSSDPNEIKSRLWSCHIEKPSLPSRNMPSQIRQTPSKSLGSQPTNLQLASTSTQNPLPKPLYSLPLVTRVIMINRGDQLNQLCDALSRSNVIGMDSEWRPVQDQKSDWSQNYWQEVSRGNIWGNRGSKVSTPRTALLQLACDHNDSVYLVDTTRFDQDPSEKLGVLLGDMFSNPSILKIAYNWEHDKRLIESTFPVLNQKRYRLQNFVDLRFIWLKFRDTQTAPKNIGSIHIISDSNTSNTSSSGIEDSDSSDTEDTNWLEAWSMFPQGPSMRRFLYGGLSNMVQTFCGKTLDKTEQCSDWERRPLTNKQLNYAAADARCLLDIHAVLERAQRID